MTAHTATDARLAALAALREEAHRLGQHKRERLMELAIDQARRDEEASDRIIRSMGL